MKAAKAAGERPAAFYALALDSSARKGELCGLQWSDLDLEQGTVTFVRQLIETDDTGAPVYGPIKNDMPRSLDLSAETVTLLKEHKRHQAELKMKNRTVYKDHGLVFAKEWGERYGRQDFLGLPLQANNIGEREFARIIRDAKVRRIDSRAASHERNVAAQGGRCGARRTTAARTQADRNDAGNLRPRAAEHAAGRR